MGAVGAGKQRHLFFRRLHGRKCFSLTDGPKTKNKKFSDIMYQNLGNIVGKLKNINYC